MIAGREPPVAATGEMILTQSLFVASPVLNVAGFADPGRTSWPSPDCRRRSEARYETCHPRQGAVGGPDWYSAL